MVGRQRQTGFGRLLGAWAAGEIEVKGGGAGNAGGIIGRLDTKGENDGLEWVSYIASPIGGVYGSVDNFSSSQEYVSREISALPDDPIGVVVESLQSLQPASNESWSLLRPGTNDDFPVFRDSNLFSPSQQAINIAAGLTRIRDKDGTALALDGTIPAQNFGRMRLDTNGLAANDGSDQTSTPIAFRRRRLARADELQSSCGDNDLVCADRCFFLPSRRLRCLLGGRERECDGDGALDFLRRRRDLDRRSHCAPRRLAAVCHAERDYRAGLSSAGGCLFPLRRESRLDDD